MSIDKIKNDWVKRWLFRKTRQESPMVIYIYIYKVKWVNVWWVIIYTYSQSITANILCGYVEGKINARNLA